MEGQGEGDMKIVIALGTYKLYDFVKLNLLQLQKIFPDASVIISDDKSERSDDIKTLAEEFGCAFCASTIRRGHFGGDVQSTVNGIAFAEQEGADIVLKLSQRLVPVLPQFREFIEKPFVDPKVNIIVPGRISQGQIRLPQSKFFGSFGVLSDVFAIRVGSISAKEFLDGYVQNMKFGRFAAQLLCEVYLGQLLATVFSNSAYISMDLANHKPSSQMVFLRKAQCDPNAYQMVANFHGLTGGHYPCEEYGVMEGRGYLSRPCLQSA